MAVYKRGETWQIDFQSNGQRVRQSANTNNKQEALELHDKLKSELWKQAKLGDKPRYTWKEAVVRFLQETDRNSKENDRLALIWLDSILGRLYLDEINRKVVDLIIRTKKNEGVKNATANRIAQLVRVILNKARNDWEWIDSIPVFNLLPEPKRRIRYLEREEANKLIAEAPPHLSVMIRFTLATGLRMSNVTGLEWSQVDLDRRCAWVHHDQAKAGKAIAVPLNNDAVVVLRQQKGIHDKYVFTYHGKRIIKAGSKAWRNCLKRCGVDDFRWHDLRHTWASWHVQNGTPIHALQELGGWSDISMVQRYAHLGSDHLAEYAKNVSSLNVIVTKSPQRVNEQK